METIPNPEALSIPSEAPFKPADFAFHNNWCFHKKTAAEENAAVRLHRFELEAKARETLVRYGALPGPGETLESSELPYDVARAIDRCVSADVGWTRSDLKAFQLAPGGAFVGPSAAARISQRKRDRAESMRRRASEELARSKEHFAKVLRRYHPSNQARVRVGRSDAAEKIETVIERLEAQRETWKAANKIFRSTKLSGEEKRSELRTLGLAPVEIEKRMIPDYSGRVGYAGWEISNLGAEIRRRREQLSRAEHLAEKAGRTATFDGGTVEDNEAAGRVQILFDAKPEPDVRDRLKAAGFRWSRRNEAWQRIRTEAAWLVAVELTSARLD